MNKIKIYKKCTESIAIITNAGDVVVHHEMIQYEYSRNIVHVTCMHVYSHNVQSPCVWLRKAVGSASDRKSRGHEFVPQPGHVTFKETDQNDA